MRRASAVLIVVALSSGAAAQEAGKPLTREDRLKWAKSLELSGDLKKAAAVLETLRKGLPDDVEVLHQSANIHVQLKEFTSASADFDALARLQPDNRQWGLMSVKTLMWSGESERAYQKIVQLVQKQPTDPELQRLRADLCFYLKRYEESGKLYGELAAKAPEDSDLRLRAAQSLFWARRYSEAEPCYRWLIEKGDASADVRLDFGQVLNAQQKFQEAAPIFRQLAAERVEKPEVLHGLLDAQMGLKDFRGAAETCEKLLTISPEDARLMERLADTLLWSEQPERAAVCYEKLLARRPDDEAVRRKLADCCMGAHDFAKAVEHFQQLHERHPNDMEIEGSLAMALYLNRQMEEAKVHLRAMLARSPDDLKTARLLAGILMEQEQFPESIAMYRKAIELGDDSQETLLRYARVLSWSRNYSEALAAYDRLTERYGRDWKIEREKARMLGWDRRYEEAMRLYDDIVKDHPESDVIQAEAQAKRAFYLEHDEHAIAHYQDLISLEPDNLEGRFDLGQVYSRQSMWPEAEQAYHDVLDRYPGHFRARDALDKVMALSTATGASPRYLYHRRRSGVRETDFRKNAFGITGSQWLTPRLQASVDYDYETYGFVDFHHVPADLYRLSLDYVSHPRWDAGVAFGLREFSNTAQDHWNYDADGRLRLFDTADLTVVSRRTDFIENSETLRQGIERDDYGVGLDWRVTNRFMLSSNYLYSDLTDTNDKNTLRAEARYRILWEPTRLDIGHRFEQWSFRRQFGEYFSPRSFQMYSFYVDWQHYLNKHELFWGTKDVYYTLGYAFLWDSTGEHTHTVQSGFHYDLSHRLSIGMDYLLTRGSVYDEDRIMGTVTFRFGGKKP